jgi:hypothetical protein
MNQVRQFPRIAARNLELRNVTLPEAFEGERNVVMIAFQQRHQALIDSWVPWLETIAKSDSKFRFYEIPTIGRIWSPFRSFIDGGMAAAIREPVILRRTLTVYGDVSRLTSPLGITNRRTIQVLAVDSQFCVRGMVQGSFNDSSAQEILRAFEIPG